MNKFLMDKDGHLTRNPEYEKETLLDGKKEIKETVQYGKIKISNVPVTVVITDGYEERYYKGSVALKLSAIDEYMEENNLTEYNFDNFKF